MPISSRKIEGGLRNEDLLSIVFLEAWRRRDVPVPAGKIDLEESPVYGADR